MEKQPNSCSFFFIFSAADSILTVCFRLYFNFSICSKSTKLKPRKVSSCCNIYWNITTPSISIVFRNRFLLAHFFSQIIDMIACDTKRVNDLVEFMFHSTRRSCLLAPLFYFSCFVISSLSMFTCFLSTRKKIKSKRGNPLEGQLVRAMLTFPADRSI